MLAQQLLPKLGQQLAFGIERKVAAICKNLAIYLYMRLVKSVILLEPEVVLWLHY